MLLRTSAIKGFKVDSLDGELGKVKDFFFDDQAWTIRYLVADTGNWLTGRRVLISPQSVASAKTAEKQLVVELTKSQIEASPSLDSDKPVSRQHEDELNAYYQWAPYWGIGPDAGFGFSMPVDLPLPPGDRKAEAQKPKGDPHLRSAHEVTGYHIHASNGDIGHVEDFVVDDEKWVIRYLIIDTKNWWPGKRVLVAPQWIERVSWVEARVFVALSREEIKLAPEYTEEAITRDYEAGLHQHYKREGYWNQERAARNAIGEQ